MQINNGTSNATKYHATILASHLQPYWDALGYQRAPHVFFVAQLHTPHGATGHS